MADNTKLIKNLFASMQQAIFLGDPLKKGEFVSFISPGQFIDTSIVEDIGTDSMAIQSDLANVLVDTSFVNNRNDTETGTSKELPGSVNKVYHDIITHAALPHRDLGAGEEKEIDDLTIWLKKNKAVYDEYRGYYDNAQDAYETERAKQNPNPNKLKKLEDAKKRDFSDWGSIGKKGLFESKKSRIVYLTSENPEMLWSGFTDTMESHRQQSPNKGEYFSTYLYPPISSWDKIPWASFEETVNEEDHYEYSHQTAWSGGVSASWGLWSVGGGSSGSTQYTHKTDDLTGVTLKFEYLRVRIFRPWLAADVFSYQSWTWKDVFGFQFLSDGGNLGVTPPLRPVGRMPVLPQYLIIVRNVELTAKFSSSVKDDYQSQVQHNVSVGWGPFSASGSYSEGTQSHYVHGEFDGVTFKIPHAQIIARTGILLPKTPNPIRTLPWDNHATFPPDHAFQEIREEDYLGILAEELYTEASYALKEEYEEKLETAKEKAFGIKNKVGNG